MDSNQAELLLHQLAKIAASLAGIDKSLRVLVGCVTTNEKGTAAIRTAAIPTRSMP
jgi:hypothetical protein